MVCPLSLPEAIPWPIAARTASDDRCPMTPPPILHGRRFRHRLGNETHDRLCVAALEAPCGPIRHGTGRAMSRHAAAVGSRMGRAWLRAPINTPIVAWVFCTEPALGAG